MSIQDKLDHVTSNIDFLGKRISEISLCIEEQKQSVATIQKEYDSLSCDDYVVFNISTGGFIKIKDFCFRPNIFSKTNSGDFMDILVEVYSSENNGFSWMSLTNGTNSSVYCEKKQTDKELILDRLRSGFPVWYFPREQKYKKDDKKEVKIFSTFVKEVIESESSNEQGNILKKENKNILIKDGYGFYFGIKP